jgi:hypothetical protein
MRRLSDTAAVPSGSAARGSLARCSTAALAVASLAFAAPGPALAAPEPAGWYAGDMHVHRSCGGPPATISSVLQAMGTNNLAACSLLADSGNGEVQDPVQDLPRVNGQDDPVSTPGRIVHWDAEWHWDAIYTQFPHQALGGHVVTLGVSSAQQVWEEYTFPVIDGAHRAGGIAGFAHMQYLDDAIPQSLSCCTPIEYPVEVALGSADFISEDVVEAGKTVGGMDPEAAVKAYYRLLNTGFRPGFSAGTDSPCNQGSALGSLLTYVQVAGGQMTYRNWVDGIARGRTVVSRNGHNEFLSLVVNGSATPGDEVQLAAGGSVPVTVQWTANQALSGTIEIVSNGVVVASRAASVTASTPQTLSATVAVPRSGWIVARRMGSAGHYVHTAAVFVTVAGAPVRASLADATFYVQWMDNLLQKTSPGGAWSSFFPTSLAAAQARYQAAKAIFQQVAVEAAAQAGTLTALAVTPAAPTVQVNASQQFTATGTYSDGSTADLTALVTWASSSPAVASVSASGVAAALSAGSTTISATSGTVSGGALLTVQPGPAGGSTLWPAGTVPGLVDAGPDGAAELGVKFRSDVPGRITGIRFYKATGNTGTHVANLWSSTGTRLATATFSGETGSGWQQVSFATPVSIAANTVYVASYHCPNGHYSDDLNYFTGKGQDSPPLHALADGTSGGNGVYAYGTSSSFPTQSWNASNYWVDVAFSASTLTSLSVSPATATLPAGATQAFVATATYSDGATLDVTSTATWSSSSTSVATVNASGVASALAPGSSTITAAVGSVTGSSLLTVQALPLAIATSSLPAATVGLAYSARLSATGGTTPYAWSVASGLPPGLSLNAATGDVSGTPATAGSYPFTARVTDAASATATRNLSIVVGSATDSTLWASTTVPGLVDGGPDGSVELGVKFRSDVAGFVKGIRFYKATANTGTHVGNLWSSAGTRLATATFAGETASGWQQVLFSSPVAVAANTVYVASYHANGGHYSADVGYFATKGVDRPPLHALANGVSGGNGVFAYGSASAFPNQTWQSANYWVDVVFSATPPVTLSSIAVTPASPIIAVGATQQFTATGTYSDGSTQNLTSTATWSSSSTAVATVGAAGLATARATGTTTISAAVGAVSGSTTLSVQPAPLGVTTASLAGGTQFLAYSATLTASGGTPPYAWSLATGSLPPGLSLDAATGAISGTPSTSGTYGFTAQVTDSAARTATKALSIAVAAAPALTVTTASLPAGTQYLAYSATLAASGGLAPYTWSIPGGGLPPGLTLDTATGAISGIPSTAGAFGFTAQVTDAASQTATKGLAISVTAAPPLAIATTALPGGTQGSPYSAALSASGGLPPYVWAVPAGLPPGLSLAPTTGLISGTPTTVGSYDFTTRVTDAAASTASRMLSINVVPPGNYTLWPSKTVPVTGDSGPDSSVELGLKFRADQAGFVTGIRFYKSAANTGTHVGSLWTSAGAKLASVTFTSETPSGWQQATFGTPVAISANTVYVASYHTNVGHYAADMGYFAGAGWDNMPLHALADGASGGNSVYRYGSGSVFPNQTWGSANYWVDVVFNPSTPVPALSSVGVTPASASLAAGATQQFTATASYADGATVDVTREATWTSSDAAIAAVNATGQATAVANGSASITATLAGVAGSASLTVSPPPPPPDEGPGGPILVISSAANPVSRYLAEILRAEGLQAYRATDLSFVTSTTLAGYDLVILGDVPVTAAQATMLGNWVSNGGNLIAMRPDKQLAGLLGLRDAGVTLSNGYLLVDTGSGPGAGIVGQTIQFHGTADLYDLDGATALATLYSTSTATTGKPAVTLRAIGAGQAAAFAYDLARSVVQTRQGNPAWSGQQRDGLLPTRSDDLFYGAASFDPQPDWIDLAKVAIPQADEQQRLLANLVVKMNLAKKPLPRFWYFPSSHKAVVVMTGDDHAGGGTAGRFNTYVSQSPAGCSVADWQCIRGTSYLYPNSPLTNSQALSFVNQGFEVSLHVSTNCADFESFADLESYYVQQGASFASRYPSVPSPKTHRTHCIVWSDYDTQPQVELARGIRLDTNYYYYPPDWLNDRPGFFTGSGMPMRFALRTGQTIDVYQAATQMTDESGQTYPTTINALLDNALGPLGYYGAFTANMHTDTTTSAGSSAIVAAAKARGVPVVSAQQMLTWLDGRNGSSFGSLSWSGGVLGFTVTFATGARNLQAMVPTQAGALRVSSVARGTTSVAFTTETIKGISYARFPVVGGSYQVSYR